MGNAPDKTIDKVFMARHSELLDHFADCDEPLFHAEDIKFPLYTDQMKIVDSTGRRVKLAGGNWSGGHMCRHCVDGLECRPLKDIAMDIRFKFKMNCIRLTYSLQLIYDNNVVPEKYIKANPALKGKTAMEIFDITVKTLTEVGLMVILNNHTSTSQWCCSNDDGDGLWWSRQYPQYMFFDHVREFAKRYKDNPRVIGMDMRNQIRKANGLEPSWGDGNPKTDWKRAAELSSQIALKQAPHWLIVIGGLNYQLDLSAVKDDPIQLSIPNKLVYSGHFYGFSWPIPSWSVYTYQNFKKKLFNSQTYVRALGVPYLLGEFGNNNQDIPWRYLMQYLKETDIDWTYWALDGFKCDPEKDQTYGVFTNDFSAARHPEMLEDMIAVGPPKTALDNYWSYLPGKSHKQTEQKVAQKPPSQQYSSSSQQYHSPQQYPSSTQEQYQHLAQHQPQKYKVQEQPQQKYESQTKTQTYQESKPQTQTYHYQESKTSQYQYQESKQQPYQETKTYQQTKSYQGQSQEGPYKVQSRQPIEREQKISEASSHQQIQAFNEKKKMYFEQMSTLNSNQPQTSPPGQQYSSPPSLDNPSTYQGQGGMFALSDPQPGNTLNYNNYGVNNLGGNNKYGNLHPGNH